MAPESSKPPPEVPLIGDNTWGILCVWAEARGEPYEGMVAVGNVVRERTARRFYSDGTVAGTVIAPHQFSWMNTSDSQRARVLTARWGDDRMELAAKAWFESAHNIVVPKCLWYHAEYVQPYWARSNQMQYQKTIGRHLFYEPAPRRDGDDRVA